MNQEEFNKAINDHIKVSQDLLISKNSAYNPGTDKLHNFKVAANLQGVSTKKALAGMMAKHTTSVYDLCNSEEDVDMYIWDEKITDHINYLLLLKAVLVDERTTSVNKNEYTTRLDRGVIDGLNITRAPQVVDLSETGQDEAPSYTAHVER